MAVRFKTLETTPFGPVVIIWEVLGGAPKVVRVVLAQPGGRGDERGDERARTLAPSARAVANALATNPFPLIAPCHRAIRSDGHLGGYQGGVALKRALLQMEGVRVDDSGRVEQPRLHYARAGASADASHDPAHPEGAR